VSGLWSTAQNVGEDNFLAKRTANSQQAGPVPVLRRSPFRWYMGRRAGFLDIKAVVRHVPDDMNVLYTEDVFAPFYIILDDVAQ